MPCSLQFPLHPPDLVFYLQMKAERCDHGDRLQGFAVRSTLVTAATSEFQTNNQRHNVFSSKESENTLMLISQPLLGSSARNSLQVSAGMVVGRLQVGHRGTGCATAELVPGLTVGPDSEAHTLGCSSRVALHVANE